MTLIEDSILFTLESQDKIDSLKFSETLKAQYPDLVPNHQALYQFLLRLSAQELISLTNTSSQILNLTPQGELFLKFGSPEYFLGLLCTGPISINDLKKVFIDEIPKKYDPPLSEDLGALFNRSLKEGKSLGFLTEEKGTISPGKVTEDATQKSLANPESNLKSLRSKKLILQSQVKYFFISKGPKYVKSMSLVKKPLKELTEDLVKSGEWKNCEFAPLNFEAHGLPLDSGHEHPLLKVRSEFRQVFLQMGFEEMDTSRWVESSFWNFDTLFQGQQHPCRDVHDTFFISDPENANPINDQEYYDRVKDMHINGGNGSIGLRYVFDDNIPLKNILRTHTTAVSSYYLKHIADEYKKTGVITPRKFFSIDRVYRNETLDATHLCEFHQVEGFVLGKNLSLQDLMLYALEFFSRIGITDVVFKPAYNPYTEPSMEIFAFHPGLGKWIEIGNSGVFRPEMLTPMGIPNEWTVVAWGFSLERPTMIEYHIDEIRKLEGPNVSLELITSVPICRLTF